MKHFRDSIGRYTKRPKSKLTKILILEIAIAISMFVWLADLTAETVFEALYPIQPVKALTEQSVASEEVISIAEHICLATNGENCDVLYNLCKAESGRFDLSKEEECQQYAVGKNWEGNFDHSWYQINDQHIIGRPDSLGKGTITLDCTYDLYCASRWANAQVKAGNLHIWVGASKI
jgi:hypothetical protein